MPVTKEEIDSFTDVLYKKFGLDFTCYEPQSLSRRINRVLHVLKKESIHDLWIAILKDEKLIHTFMDELSVGLTSMFRDPLMWTGLRSIIYNEYKFKDNISIWNAGCSTGEEIYTMAIVLKEMGILNAAQITASDMNQTALAIAKKGVYHKIKMTEYEKKFREYNKFGYFDKYLEPFDTNHIQMDRDLIKNVTFKYHNLITDPINGQFDIIFCRNVMIYFDAPSKNILVNKFRNALKPGGYFIIGYFDSVIAEDQRTQFDSSLANLRIFKKGAA